MTPDVRLDFSFPPFYITARFPSSFQVRREILHILSLCCNNPVLSKKAEHHRHYDR
jgi:hypothetical protein